MENLKSKYQYRPITAVKIGLASPSQIMSWSHGKVTKPETINYKSHNIVSDGLFDEVIFGPTKNYECACGKYKKIQNIGRICERCGVEITQRLVRRERMGHIELNAPVAHIWMLKNTPSPIALALNLKAKKLEEIIYFVNYVVLDPGNSKNLEYKMVLDLGNINNSQENRQKILKDLQDIVERIDDYGSFDYEFGKELIEEIKDASTPFSIEECTDYLSKHLGVKLGIGAEAVRELLKNIDLDSEIKDSLEIIKVTKSAYQKTFLAKRLEVLCGLKRSDQKPEWMVLTILPVIPPELRPIVQLTNGRFTASELNDLYRTVILCNERLKKTILVDAPQAIINNAKRLLQEAVDALFDNDRKSNPTITHDRRPLKSLTSNLKGKQGRFRQNLLGKRVDYSGHTVVVVDPKLKLYQCGLPKAMALELFKPFLINKLITDEHASNIKIAQQMIEDKEKIVYEALEEVVKTRPILLNRPPTLYCLGIEAYEIVLVNDKTIHLHTLEARKFNADCDGDQMIVHLPLSPEAVAEARGLMLGYNWILIPSDGKPGVLPSQDMVLGIYYLTLEEKNKKGEGTIFFNMDDAVRAYEMEQVDLWAIIGIEICNLKGFDFTEDQQNKILVTSVGKIIFNQIFDRVFPWVNSPETIKYPEKIVNSIIDYGTDIQDFITNKYQVSRALNKNDLSDIVYKYFLKYGSHKTAVMLDRLKDHGFHFSKISGVTISRGDIKSYDDKYELFHETEKVISKIYLAYKSGYVTKPEFKKLICQKWTEVKNKVEKKVVSLLENDPFNPIFMMANSGARGNASNFTQLVGMRGLMTNASGNIIEIPVKSSFTEGLSMLEFFISTHGARKGRVDVALKTADAGYLTRRLESAAQEVQTNTLDCNSEEGLLIHDIVDTKQGTIIESWQERALGRFLFKPITLKDGTTIDNEHFLTETDIAKLSNGGITEILIRSVLTCESHEEGICQKCFGMDLMKQKLVAKNKAVGIMSAQAIGEPGTQLTMRTFHTGGVAGGQDITRGLPRITEIFDVIYPKGMIAELAEITGTVTSIIRKNSVYHITINSVYDEIEQKTLPNAQIRVVEGDKVTRGDKLTEGSIDMHRLLVISSSLTVKRYILKEVQKVYRSQGIEISDKYIEIIIKQMFYGKVIDLGGTDLLFDQLISINQYRQIVKSSIKNKIQPPRIKIVLLGIKKSALHSNFLSAASFQDLTRVLTKAIVRGEVDKLRGLKSIAMIGGLIESGTGCMPRKDVLHIGDEALADQY